MVGLHCGVYFYETLRYVSDSIARLVEVSVLPLSGDATVCVLRLIFGRCFVFFNTMVETFKNNFKKIVVIAKILVHVCNR